MMTPQDLSLMSAKLAEKKREWEKLAGWTGQAFRYRNAEILSSSLSSDELAAGKFSSTDEEVVKDDSTGAPPPLVRDDRYGTTGAPPPLQDLHAPHGTGHVTSGPGGVIPGPISVTTGKEGLGADKVCWMGGVEGGGRRKGPWVERGGQKEGVVVGGR